jgi:large subunit ribosomal protein L32
VAVPKKKLSKSRRDKRRANHDRMDHPAVSNCRQCGAPARPHMACPECGTYRDRQVIDVDKGEEEKSESK